MAPRTQYRLTDLGVKHLKEGGWHADGGGLYLRIDPRTASRRWVYVFRWAGKRQEMGLGGAGDVSLSDARIARDAARKLVRDGVNPINSRREEVAARSRQAVVAKPLTFAEWAREIAPVVAPKSPKAHEAWLRMMTDWVGPLKDKVPGQIVTEDVLAALKPYWKTRPETGQRMRMRIEAVLDAAKAKGQIADPWSNPARWKGHLQHLLEKRSKPVKHHAAMPYGNLPAFMADLGQKEHMSARALIFTILTCARTSETIKATWAEVDLAGKVWTVPAARMKAKRPHRVPLTAAALAVLEAVKHPDGVRPSDWVFPSQYRAGRPLSTAAMERALEDMGLKGVATVHGFRSSFRDWAGDATNFATDTIEAALAHLVGDETERAYRRGDALLKRRKLMDAWSGYLTRPAAANVTPMVRPS